MKKKNLRIFVYRTGKHFYAQLIDLVGNVKFTYSTLQTKDSASKANLCNTASISMLAKKFASHLVENNLISTVYYDRGSKIYSGLIKQFADSLRENGVLI